MKRAILLSCCLILGIVLLAVFDVLRRENIKLAFYARVPLSAALFLGLIGPLAAWSAGSPLRHMGGNAFLVYSTWQLATTTVICLLAASLIGLVYRNIEYNGRERFLGITLDIETLLNDKNTVAKRKTKQQIKQEVAAVSIDPALSSKLSGDQTVAAKSKYAFVRWVEYVRTYVFDPTFGQSSWGRLRTGWFLSLILLIGFSAPYCCLRYSIVEGAWDKGTNAGVVAMLIGTVVAVFFLVFASFISNKFAPTDLQLPLIYGFDLTKLFGETTPTKSAEAFGNWWASWTSGPGYASQFPPKSGEFVFHPGHLQLAIHTGILAIVYFLAFILSPPTINSGDERWLPTVAYIAFVVSFVASILSSLAFLLDFYHAPSTLVLGVILILIYSSPWHSPASFQAVPACGITSPPKLFDALSKRIERANERWPRQASDTGKTGRKERVLVVVTAPGGGIHAAAWTSRVLTGLHERYGKPFDDSLGVVSGVSGGGMGGWVYVDALGREDDTAVEKAIGKVNEITEASSLDAIAWGLAFPDLIRAVNPLPWSPNDRGRVLENTWDARLEGPKKSEDGSRCRTLNDLAAKSMKGEIPLIVWSATDVVSGQRIVIAPVEDAVTPVEDAVTNTEAAVDLYRFLRTCYPGQPLDLRAATAARLAATFPYVTPIVGMDRIDMVKVPPAETGDRERLSQLRCIDGGYFDNEGLVTAVRWVSRFLEQLETTEGTPPPVDKILVVRIDPNSPGDPAKDTGLDAVMSVIGPILALMNVRSASQAERGNIEADLLIRAAQERRTQAKKSYDKLQENTAVTHEDFQKLWHPDWKERIFADADSATGQRLVSAAVKNILPEDVELTSVSDKILPSDSVDEGKNQITTLLNKLGLPATQTVGEFTKNIETKGTPELKEVVADKTNVISKSLEKLRGSSRTNAVRQIKVEMVTIPFANSQAATPPLSWALSPEEKKMYKQAWEQLERDVEIRVADGKQHPPLAALDAIFYCRHGVPK